MLLLTLFVQAPARAEPVERSNTVLLSVAAPAGEAAELEAVARGLLARLDVTIEARRVPRIDLTELRVEPRVGEIRQHERRRKPRERHFGRGEARRIVPGRRRRGWGRKEERADERETSRTHGRAPTSTRGRGED